MKKVRRTKKKVVQRAGTYRKMLDKTLKEKRRRDMNNYKKIAEERIESNIKSRNRNLRQLIKSRNSHQSPIVKAQKRNIIKYNHEIINDRRFIICNQRAERREYLFNSGRAGKGIAGPKNKIYNNNSKVRC